MDDVAFDLFISGFVVVVENVQLYGKYKHILVYYLTSNSHDYESFFN